MNGTIRAMTHLIGCEACGEKLNSELYASLTKEEKSELYRLSKKHDLAHIVGNALIKNNLIDDESLKEKYRQEVYTAVFRYESIAYEIETLKKAFNEEKIPFILLKGSVIRKYYAEPWLRTSCDIDILIKEESLEKAITALQEKIGYTTDGKKHYHDVSLFSPAGVHLELHHNIKETIESLDRVLNKAWDYADIKENCEYAFTNEFFLYHLYAHAAYHFAGGGCGVRTFLDLFLLKKRIVCDAGKLAEMLTEAGIKKFAEQADNLSEIWFGNGEHDDISSAMEKFVLSGGVYGSSVNHAAVKHVEKKSKLRHIMSRIWMPYESLAIKYPKLKGKRILQPFYEVKRWCSLFKGSVFKRGVNELKANAAVDKEMTCEIEKLMKNLGLNCDTAKK